MKNDSERRLNVSNKFNKSNKMTDYYRNDKNQISSSSESTITIKDKNKDRDYYSSYRKSHSSHKRRYPYYKNDDKYENRPYNRDKSREREKDRDYERDTSKNRYKDYYKDSYREKYKDSYRDYIDRDRERDRERYPPYYQKNDSYDKYERKSKIRRSYKKYVSKSRSKNGNTNGSRSRSRRNKDNVKTELNNNNYNNIKYNIKNNNYSKTNNNLQKQEERKIKKKPRDYKEERRKLRERSRSNSVLRMMKIKNIENSKGTLYQRNYSRPHENNDPLKPHLYWDGYQWIARPHTTEEIIKLNERKVQMVNMPLSYNLKKSQIKKYILEKMLEKGVISSKLSEEEKKKKIEDVELNKDTNVVLLTMENLELAKSMILLDGMILLGQTIRLSLYSEVKDLSLDNIQKASAMANSANVTAKSAAISLTAFESIFRSSVGKKDIILNVNTNNENVRNKDTSNVIKIMGLLGREDDNEENKLDEKEYKELYDDMEEAFSPYGKIKKLLVVGEKEERLGAEIGSVFIQYASVRGAEDAYRAMSNKKYKGNDINIIFVPLYVFINDIILEPNIDGDEKDKDNNDKNKKEEIPDKNKASNDKNKE